MSLEEYILKVIKDTGLSRQEIFQMIESKKREIQKSITDLVALFIITKDLCIDI